MLDAGEETGTAVNVVHKRIAEVGWRKTRRVIYTRRHEANGDDPHPWCLSVLVYDSEH